MAERLNWNFTSGRGTDSIGSSASVIDKERSPWHSLFTEERHKEKDPSLLEPRVDQWRMKERMKTVSVVLVVCLNIGVDPPDVIKTTPCAKLECWVDPHALPPPKAVDTIGKTLQMQYERWQPRARYKLCLDPNPEAVKKQCNSLRRNAKDERTLFHYNGHGVPKPTDIGEIWVFNSDYTQYKPVSIYDIQQWLGSPSLYVFDCNSAGTIVKWFNKFTDQRQADRERNPARSTLSAPGTPVPEDHILLASCSEGEMLPTNPDLPADIFTACLTTPIKMALKWFVPQTIISGVTLDLIDHIPGRLNDRRTPLGELNWIFTAVTDTIAWHVLPRHLFQKLFRQDLLVACLFRNFLLAERIMRSCRCTPISSPKLPPTYNHPMWQAWDLAADYCLAQLPKIIANPNIEFKHCTFFTEQLTAFEVWLEFGAHGKRPPEQLPIVLQVLLSQQHRLRALVLLSKFLDLGAWAVNQGLSVGIFPYVLKLLQSPAIELREVLIFIWAKILAVDRSCRTDLVKENGQSYFISILNNHAIPSQQRMQTAFILSVICQNDYRYNDSRAGGVIAPSQGQIVCLQAKLLQNCLSQLDDPDPTLRRWVVFCLAKLWENYEEAKTVGITEKAYEKLCSLLTDPVPEVRAAAVYALGTFISNESGANRSPHRVEIEFNLGITLPAVNGDSSPMVRREFAIALANFVHSYHDMFVEEAKRQRLMEYAQLARKQAASKSDSKSAFTASPASSGSSTPLRSSSAASLDASGALALSSSIGSRGSGIAGAQALHASIECQAILSALGGVYEEIPSDYPVFEFIWKYVRSLAADPVPSVSQVTQHIVSRLRTQSLQHHINSLQTHGYDASTLEALVGYSSSKKSGPSSLDYSQGRSPSRRDAAQSNHTSSSGPSSGNLRQTQSSSTYSQGLSSSSSSSSNSNGQQTSSKKGLSGSTSSRTLSNSQLLPGARKSTAAGSLNVSVDDAAQIYVDRSGGDENGYHLPIELASTLYDWACLSFSSPMLRPSEEDETTPDYSERRWRQQRNEHLLLEAQAMYADKTASMPRKLENEITVIETDTGAGSGSSSMVSSLLFHSFEPIVVLADPTRFISIWNWEEGQRISVIDNKNSGNSRISSLALLNEHDMALIAAGSDDGIVKIWSGVYNTSHRLVTAFRTFPDVQPLTRTRGAGLILEWQQKQDSLFAAGNVGVIRQWDLSRELTSLDISTGISEAVTCLASDQRNGSGKLLYAGFADGSVRLYDTRLAGSQLVHTMTELKGNPVVSVSLPTCSDSLICGSTAGIVKFWDCKTQNSNSTITTAASPNAMMQALSAHDQTPIIAIGSTDQRIKVLNYKGEEISHIRYHEGFLGQRISPVTCLTFHSCHNLLAAGFQDALVSIYAGETFKAVST